MMTISRNTALASENNEFLKEINNEELSKDFINNLPKYCRLFEILNGIYQRELANK